MFFFAFRYKTSTDRRCPKTNRGPDDEVIMLKNLQQFSLLEPFSNAIAIIIIAMLSDWHKNHVPVFQPISKTRTNINHTFEQVTGNC